MNSKGKIVSRKKSEMVRERFLKKKKEANMKEVDANVLKLAKSEVSEFLPKKKKYILKFKKEVNIKPASDLSYSSSYEPDIDYHNKYIDVKTKFDEMKNVDFFSDDSEVFTDHKHIPVIVYNSRCR